MSYYQYKTSVVNICCTLLYINHHPVFSNTGICPPVSPSVLLYLHVFACLHLSLFSHVSSQSTLLQCILSELPVLSGRVTVNGSLAYACQEPWLFSASLRDNILFGRPYDHAWYSTVVEACALEKASLMQGSMNICWCCDVYKQVQQQLTLSKA